MQKINDERRQTAKTNNIIKKKRLTKQIIVSQGQYVINI